MAIKNIEKIIEKDGILFMAYVGFMTQTILSGLIEALEHEKKLSDIPNVSSHNVLSVLIEMTQNIIKYSKDDSSQNKGLVSVGKNDQGFYVYSQNVVSLKDSQKIEKKINTIKKLNDDEIKKEYRSLRRSGVDSHEKGAGIGLYDIAKRAKDLNFEFKKINDDEYIFYFSVQIKEGK